MDDTDEFAGHGGSYLLDPKTGKRTLVHRTEVPVPGAAEPTTQSASTKAQPAPSGIATASGKKGA